MSTRRKDRTGLRYGRLAVIAQSWGLGHGDRGRVYLPLEDLDKQLRAGGTCSFVHGEKRVVRLP